MGNNPSADKLRIVKTPLHKPSTAVAAVSTAFCGKNGVTLHIEEQLLDSVTVRDARSGQLCFRVADVVPSIFTQKTLIDANGELIATITKEPYGYLKTFHVDSVTERLFSIQTKLSIAHTLLDVAFQNVVTGRQCRMTYDGDTSLRNGLICLDPGDGQILTIARIHRPTMSKWQLQEFYVEIPPNIDTAMIVMVCLALDQARRA